MRKKIETNEAFQTALRKHLGDKRGATTRLAKAIGTTQPTVANHLKGVTTPDLEKLVKIAGYFGVSIDNLLGYRPDNDTALRRAGRTGYADGLRMAADAAADMSNRLAAMAEKYRYGGGQP